MVKPENYVTIQGWMLTELNLKGNELLIYAIIYGFTQNCEQDFTGSLQYLAEWTNTSKRTIITTLKSLVEKGLILKEEEIKNGVKFCKYRAVVNFTGGEEISPGVVKNFHRGGEEISPNNNRDNIDRYNSKKENIKEKEEFISLINDFVEVNKYSITTKNSIIEWLDYKKERKNKYTQIGFSKLLSQIKKCIDKHGEQAFSELVDKCIASGYQGLIFDILEKKTNKPYETLHERNQREFEKLYAELEEEKRNNL